MAGRATTRIIKKTASPEMQDRRGTKDDAVNMSSLANAYGTQARRLNHIATRIKLMLKIQRECHGLESAERELANASEAFRSAADKFKTYKELNEATLKVVGRSKAGHDPEAADIIDEVIRKAELHQTMAYSAIKRAADWHDKKAASLFQKADGLHRKKFQEQLEDKKKE